MTLFLALDPPSDNIFFRKGTVLVAMKIIRDTFQRFSDPRLCTTPTLQYNFRPPIRNQGPDYHQNERVFDVGLYPKNNKWIKSIFRQVKER